MLLVHCQLHPLPLGYCPSMKLLNMSRHLLLTVTVKVALSPPRPHHLCKKSYPEGLVASSAFPQRARAWSAGVVSGRGAPSRSPRRLSAWCVRPSWVMNVDLRLRHQIGDVRDSRVSKRPCPDHINSPYSSE